MVHGGDDDDDCSDDDDDENEDSNYREITACDDGRDFVANVTISAFIIIIVIIHPML